MLAPENTTLDAYIPAAHKETVDAYRNETAKKTAVERQQNEKEKTGVFAGVYLAHPFTGESAHRDCCNIALLSTKLMYDVGVYVSCTLPF